MSGGSGGVIILNKVAETASLEVVGQNLTPAEKAQLQAVLAKQCGDWSGRDLRKVQSLIAKAVSRCR
jgi:hypothetical protein